MLVCPIEGCCGTIVLMSQELKAVILGLDQTLTTDEGSWTQFTGLLGASPVRHTEIYEDFKAGRISYVVAKQHLIALWRSVSSLDKTTIQAVFNQIKLRDGALEAVAYLKSKYRICIISGAVDVFVAGIAKRLGVEDNFAATQLIFDSNNELIDFDYKVSRDEEKVSFLDTFCSKYSLSPKDCAAIGDGESDMPLFSRVGFPILYLAAETTLEQRQKVPIHLASWSDVYKHL